MRVACHFDLKSVRGRYIAEAMRLGIKAAGHKAHLVAGWETPRPADAVLAYGWARPDLFEAYRAHGKPFIHVDLGWWDRKPEKDLLGGFHKVTVNAREPVAYFRGNFATERFARQGLTVAPWREDGSHVLLAGMSAKSAGTRGLGPQEWETSMVGVLRSLTARPIIYRPKPSWAGATPIPGTIFSGPEQPIEAVLRDCWAAVTLHSNVAVDALMAGIPVNVAEGVARDFSTPIVQIETPRMPEGRDELMADIAWCQWNVEEMRSGECFRHLLESTPLCG